MVALMSFWALVVAGVLLVLTAFGVAFGPCHLGWLALAIVAFALAAGYWPGKPG